MQQRPEVQPLPADRQDLHGSEGRPQLLLRKGRRSSARRAGALWHGDFTGSLRAGVRDVRQLHWHHCEGSVHPAEPHGSMQRYCHTMFGGDLRPEAGSGLTSEAGDVPPPGSMWNRIAPFTPGMGLISRGHSHWSRYYHNKQIFMPSGSAIIGAGINRTLYVHTQSDRPCVLKIVGKG